MDSVPGRMGFLLTHVLCIINLLNATVVNSPRSGGHPTAIVYWILSCLIFTLFAIVEYAMILRYIKYRITPSDIATNITGPRKENDKENLFKRWDNMMFLVMPLIFAILSVAFWIFHHHY